MRKSRRATAATGSMPKAEVFRAASKADHWSGVITNAIFFMASRTKRNCRGLVNTFYFQIGNFLSLIPQPLALNPSLPSMPDRFPTITDHEWRVGLAAARARRVVRSQYFTLYLKNAIQEAQQCSDLSNREETPSRDPAQQDGAGSGA
jgi:hypothetical protein